MSSADSGDVIEKALLGGTRRECFGLKPQNFRAASTAVHQDAFIIDMDRSYHWINVTWSRGGLLVVNMLLQGTLGH